MEGKFIVFEGTSGSGKGTQARRTAQYIQSLDEHASVLTTPEPTGSAYGREVRALMELHRKQEENPENHVQEYLDFFIKDRVQHQEMITQNLSWGAYVIGVRYYHSTIVHQQCASLPAEEIIARHRQANIRRPDLTVILDIREGRALYRLTARKKKGIYETPERLRRSRERYLQLPQLLPEEKVVIVNGLGSVDAVFEYYRPAIENVLGYTKMR